MWGQLGRVPGGALWHGIPTAFAFRAFVSEIPYFLIGNPSPPLTHQLNPLLGLSFHSEHLHLPLWRQAQLTEHLWMIKVVQSQRERREGALICAMLLSGFQRFSRKESFCVHKPGSTLSPRSYQPTLPHSRGQIFGRAGVWVELCKWIRPSPFLWRQESMGWMWSCKSWFYRLPTWSDFEPQLCGPRCSETLSWVCLFTYTSVFLGFVNTIS